MSLGFKLPSFKLPGFRSSRNQTPGPGPRPSVSQAPTVSKLPLSATSTSQTVAVATSQPHLSASHPSSPNEWIGALITASKPLVSLGAPFPYLSAALSSGIALLELIKSVGQSSEDLKSLSESVVEFMKILNEEVDAHPGTENPGFRQTCDEFRRDLDRIREDLEIISKDWSDSKVAKYFNSQNMEGRILQFKEDINNRRANTIYRNVLGTRFELAPVANTVQDIHSDLDGIRTALDNVTSEVRGIRASRSTTTSGLEEAMRSLKTAAVSEAFYDSENGSPQPKCHEKTRQQMLDHLFSWATGNYDSLANHPICWLHGPAGAGKSAIMWSLCARLAEVKCLEGTFFFKRDHVTRGNARVLFTTLAYQLALHDTQLKSTILKKVEAAPKLCTSLMSIQLENLIVQPCTSVMDRPVILLIDGLDECQETQTQQAILRLILETALRHPMSFRFLVASRPEGYLSKMFKEISSHNILYMVNIKESFLDVRSFFVAEFARIRSERSLMLADLSFPWPTEDVLRYLVETSSGYFIYPSMVIRVLDHEYHDPAERLSAIVNPSLAEESPFGALDQLYLKVLTNIPSHLRDTLRDILCLITNFTLSPRMVQRFLNIPPPGREITLNLYWLSSILKIPRRLPFDDSNLNLNDDGAVKKHPGLREFFVDAVTLYHASFRDFLYDPRRSSDFTIDVARRQKLALWILSVFSHKRDHRTELGPAGIIFAQGSRWVDFVTDVSLPTQDAAKLLHSFDLGWCWLSPSGVELCDATQRILSWLKKDGFPEALIQRWDGYVFMANSVRLINDRWPHLGRSDYDDLSKDTLADVMKRAPQLSQIIRARALLNSEASIDFVRSILDVSWDELSTELSRLRTVGDDYTETVVHILQHRCSLQEMPPDERACALVQLVQRIGWHPKAARCRSLLATSLVLPLRFWGYYVRTGPTILLELGCFAPPWERDLDFAAKNPLGIFNYKNFLTIVEWLTVHPDVESDVIKRWNGYLQQVLCWERSFTSPLTMDDVIAVKEILGVLPPHLICYILDLAAYYACLKSGHSCEAENETASEVVDESSNIDFIDFISQPILEHSLKDGKDNVNVRVHSVQFRITSRDQGWSVHPELKQTYRGYTWFEAAILRPSPEPYAEPIEVDDARWIIQTNVVASSNLREHIVTWDAREKSPTSDSLRALGPLGMDPAPNTDIETGRGNGSGFVARLLPGDRIKVSARDMYEGWNNDVMSVQISVYYHLVCGK